MIEFIVSLIFSVALTEEIKIMGQFQKLRLGSTSTISCSVPQLMNSNIKWISPSGAIVSSSGALMLFGNHSINGRIFRCVVNSSQLHSSGERNITVTVKSMFLMITKVYMNIHLFTDTYVSMVSVSVTDLMVPVGTDSHQIVCFVTLNSFIGPNINALSVSWLHNNRTIEDKINMSKRFIPRTFFNSSLTLSDISQHDSGEYCCTASIAGNQTKPKDCVKLKVTVNGE